MRYAFDTEEWRPVIGVFGYEVSSLGRVRSVDRLIACRDGRTRRFRGQGLAARPDTRMGYLRVCLTVGAQAIGRTVHSLVADAFLGPRPPGKEVRHKNGQSADCRAVNLEYGTRSDNMRDAVAHGTHANVAKDSCPREHALRAPNLVASKAAKGVRECLACARTRAYIQRHPTLQGDAAAIADRYHESIMGVAA